MNASDRNVNVVKQLVEILHFQARTEEHHHFLVPVLSKESKQQQESFLRGTNNVALKQQLNTQT